MKKNHYMLLMFSFSVLIMIILLFYKKNLPDNLSISDVKSIRPLHELHFKQKESISKNASLPINSKKIFAIIEPELKNSFFAYNDLRKNRVFLHTLNDKIEENFKGKMVLEKIENYFSNSLTQNGFDKDNESLRLMMIDYLGDVALGNIKFENQTRAQIILDNLLKKDSIKIDMVNRLKKSLIGDKIDLMAIYTQLNRENALAYLKENTTSKYYPYLKVGFINGLFFSGEKKEVIHNFKKIL